MAVVAAAGETVRQPSRALTTVVFDVGMVLLAWDPRHLYRQIFDDPVEMEWFLANVCTLEWNLAQDGGRSWPDAEAEVIAHFPAYTTQIRAFRARWQEMVPGAIVGTVTILEKLAEARVPLYAITNFASDTFLESRARHPFFEHFHGIVVSGETGLLKPDAAIYHRLASDFGVDLESCVFIDDVDRNVAGAEAVGMHALLFTGPDQLAKDLVALGFPAV